VSSRLRKSWIASIVGSIVVLAGVGGTAAALVGWKAFQLQQMASQGPPPEMPTYVEMAVAKPIVFRQTSTSVGTVIAPQSIVLSNELPGTVSKSNLSPGAIVDAGTVLLQLDTSIERAQLEAAQSAVKIAVSRFDRTKEAFRSRALTELELEESESQWKQSQARVTELEAIIAKKTLTAPFRARVGLSDTHPGQYLPSGTQITSLQSVLDYVFVDFAVPQQVAYSVAVGQTVSLISGEYRWQGSIQAFDARSDKLTRNVVGRVRLDNAPPFLKPGDSLKVALEYGPQVHAIGIPAAAVRRTPTGAITFVVTGHGGETRVQQRTLTVLNSIGEQVAVSSGVAEGESIVTTGSFKLLDGGLIAVSSPIAEPSNELMSPR
jgi:membrane fusion protein, multidrug efflux system